MFVRSINLTNVQGRIKYCRDKENREEVVGFYNTTSDEFWRLLAKENQARFLESTNAKRPNAKASEAREFLIGLPSHVNDDMSAMMLAHMIKRHLKVECVVSIHKKYSLQPDGTKKLNVHAHVIVAERQLLPEPIVIEEKRADRTYYYDEKGKKCKKADAVRVTRKGDVIQEASVRYFTNKKDFYSHHKENPLEKIEPLIDTLSATFGWEKFDGKRHFAYRHVGAGNPKAKHVEAYNALVKDLNAFFDRFEIEGTVPMKKQFCRATGVSERFGVNRTDEVREAFELYKQNLEATLREQLATLRYNERQIKNDIDLAESVFDPAAENDFVKGLLAQANRNTLEQKYNVNLTPSFVDRLKEKLDVIRKAIQNVAERLRKLGAGDNKEHALQVNRKKEQEGISLD